MDAKESFSTVSLAKRVIIVTGGSSGIGRATAKLCAARGAAVMIADVNEAGGKETLADIKKAGGRASFKRTDVSNEADAKALVEATVSEFGKLDGAFNNAGVGGKVGDPIPDWTLAEWQRVIDINLTGVYLCLKYELAYMSKHDGGSIVNTSSSGGVCGLPTAPAYVAAKHGVVGLTRNAAYDYSPGIRGAVIRVNAVVPHATDTPMMRECTGGDPKLMDLIQKTLRFGRVAEPSELAEMVAWLLSDAASYCTGSVYYVDGGYCSM